MFSIVSADLGSSGAHVGHVSALYKYPYCTQCDADEDDNDNDDDIDTMMTNVVIIRTTDTVTSVIIILTSVTGTVLAL